MPRRTLPATPLACRAGLLGTLAALVVTLTAAAAPVAAAVPPPGSACPRGLPLLTSGNRGPAVAQLQRRLGITPATGRFGPLTRKVVRRVQAEHRLVRDGVVGPRTWQALGCAPQTARPAKARRTMPIPAAVLALDWAVLAHCESRGNAGAVNPRGFYGLYQFSLGTWRSTGGSGAPHRASAAEQTYRAQVLFVRAGAGQWPRCGRLLFG